MTTKRSILQSKADQRAVILGQKSEVQRLQQVLEVIFNHVDILESIREVNFLPAAISPRLLVATDSFHDGLNLSLLETVKAKLSPGEIICIAKHFDTPMEIKLRSAGLTFLGSYEAFFNYAEEILGGVSERRFGRQGSPDGMPSRLVQLRRDLAKKVQTRLCSGAYPLKSLTSRNTLRVVTWLAEVPMRIVEILVGLMVCTLLIPPVLLVFFWRKLIAGVPVFHPRTVAGSYGRAITIHQFNRVWPPLRNLPLFYDLLTCRLALVGTAITDWDQHLPVPENGYIRLVKPGIFSLWQVRQASRIAHEGQGAIEWEYVFKKRLVYDFLLLLRVLPSILFGGSSSDSPDSLRIFDLNITNLTMREAIARIDQTVAGATQNSVFFVNPDCLNKMVTDPHYFQVLRAADQIFPDGIGLTVAGKMLRTPLKENINGTDMFPFLCEMAATRDYSFFLLGGRPGVAAEMARRIQDRYQVRIAGTAHGYFDHENDCAQVVEQINQSGADILLVGFGAPVQEKWIAARRSDLAPKVLMGVGGLFDFYSGNIKRAPRWVREIGLEWVYRIIQEPRRMWRRYVIGNPVFLYRVMKWKFFSR
jgi:N-acetylglucosaminyldiphosphoundecaprenol N-acetyl-beta-D-mannosaminyltransferase